MKFMEGTCLLYKDLAIDELVKHGYIDGSCAKSLRSEYCQLKGKARYSILRLPLNSIATIRNPTKREKDFLRIKGGTFPTISNRMRIRPRAAEFIKNRRAATYVVTYETRRGTECLFVFQLHGKKAEQIQMVRAIGKSCVKQHKHKIVCFIKKEKQAIELLQKGEALTF